MGKITLEYFMEMCITLASEKDGVLFLERTLQDAREITHADAGTLYIYEDGLLHFSIMHNDTMGVHNGVNGEKIDLPPVPYREENVCSYVAIHRKMVNIPDVYNSQEFDFSGPKNYDAITGYNTKSMLVVPLINNNDEIIGVIQLINAKNEAGEVVAFAPDYQQIVFSLCSLAAVSLTNIRYTQEIKDLFQSFVKVLSTAIDERTPFNANHTKNVANYAGKLSDRMNQLFEEEQFPHYFDKNRREQLVMSAWLHDIGKLVTPLEVVNKSGRVADRWETIDLRLQVIADQVELAYLKGNLPLEAYQARAAEVVEVRELLQQVDRVPFLSDENLAKVNALADKTYINSWGEELPWFTPFELDSLRVRKGNLTASERKIMEDHVVITGKLLSQIKFSHDYENVPKWASSHHEFLDGTGYPMHYTKAELPMEVRILTALDIFDALTANDRPYKPAMPVDKAIRILEEMVAEGKLDAQVVDCVAKTNLLERS